MFHRLIAAVFTVINNVLSVLNKTWVGEGTGQKLAPFLGNSKVVDRPYPWGLTDEGENMAKRTYFSF